MTNETTASQPKSIGDDAQFRELLENVQHENHCRMDGEDVALIALIVFIDSKLRAPAAQASAEVVRNNVPGSPHNVCRTTEHNLRKRIAELEAQASATIQAAPDTNELHFNAQRLRNVAALVGVPADGDDAHVDGVRGALLGLIATKLRLAATIQEPVMVAEPVGFADFAKKVAIWSAEIVRLIGVAEKVYGQTCGALESQFEVADYMRRQAEQFAAPMVADPAGVTADNWPALLVNVDLAAQRARFESFAWPKRLNFRKHADQQYVEVDTADAWKGWIAHAATVKAIPSEALEVGPFTLEQRMPPKGEEVLIYFAGSNGKMECRIDEWDDLHEDPIGMGGPTICVGEGWISYYEDNVTHWAPIPAVHFAAPLADKTGGGE